MAAEESTWGGQRTSQLKIILLGGRNSGKSSVGNLLLAREEFGSGERTTCCLRQGVVAGRRLTVVDTPGWWCDFTAQETSLQVKREIIHSVSLCSPGPHVFLITIKAGSAFTEKRRRAVEQHVSLLGEKVWTHCMVVFIRAHSSSDSEEEEAQALSWLTEKCSHRCHSLTSRDGTEAAELLEKIQKLVTENRSAVFEMQEEILRAAAEEKSRVEERALQRFVRMKKHRSLVRGRLQPITNLRIVLVGAKGSGKTSTLNTILGRGGVPGASRTSRCEVAAGVVFGRQVTVVDTPGWWMNYFSEETPAFERRELLRSLTLCPPGPHVLLLVVRADRAFTETYRRAVQEHLQLLSPNIWSRVILLLSCGDCVEDCAEQHLESEGEALQWLVHRCEDRYHVLDNTCRADGFQVRELIGKIEEMVASRGGQHFELERKVVERMELEVRRERERVKERLTRKEKQRQKARAQLEKLSPLPVLRVVLLGGKKTGKSSCGNTILGKTSFLTDTNSGSCMEGRAQISGRTVEVLDTPGCFPVTSDLLGPSCVLLLVVNASASFGRGHMEALEKQLEAGGGLSWSRALVLFSHGDWLGETSIESRAESEGAELQSLLQRCGDRYHVLDNKHCKDGAQVQELVQLIEETLAEERLNDLSSGDQLWRDVPVATDTEQLQGAEVLEPISCSNSTVPTSSTTQTSVDGSDLRGQMVAVPAAAAGGGGGGGRRRGRGRGGRNGLTILDRDSVMSCLASLLCGAPRQRWTINLPFNLPQWLPADDHLHLTLSADSPAHHSSARHLITLLGLSHTPHRMLAEGNAAGVDSPCLRERTLHRLGESGGLQALIDQWDASSLEELEAFIDSYFEMVWEQTMESVQQAEPEELPAPREVQEEVQGDVLASINRKLSKLELLEEMRRDMADLRTRLEDGLKVIQDLRDRSKQDDNNNTS